MYLVIETQLALWHATEEGAHFQRTHHLRPDYCAIAVDQQVDALHYVQKDLVLLVLDAFTAP